MIDSAQWINLPVGYNLDDHVNVKPIFPMSIWARRLTVLQTNIVFEHPHIINYDFNDAYNNPIAADAEKYLGTWLTVCMMATDANHI